MSELTQAFVGAAVFDGLELYHGHALLVQGNQIKAIVPDRNVAKNIPVTRLASGTLAPGFVDLQVNGGGGVMLNDDPSVATLRRMSAAHRRLGATAILPTLITDTDQAISAAIAATEQAIAEGVPGIIGLHLEGPHLAVTRKGAHDAKFIRPMTTRDLDRLCEAARVLPVLKITLAPESVTQQQMRILASAGAVLSLGHTDATYDQCVSAARAGVSCVTHLFNAMRPLGAREPGVVGAALALGSLSAGMIGDLIHVHGDTMRLALAAKQEPGQIFLVSDAMAVAGTDIQSFTLNGRLITRDGGRLTLGDGTLAGADLDLATAVRNLNSIGVPLAEALSMATSRPAKIIGQAHCLGHLRPGVCADFVHLDGGLQLKYIWHSGRMVKGP